MNPYNFSLLLFAFGNFFIGLLVWFKRQDDIGQIYFVISLCVAIWALGFSLMVSNNASYEAALFSARLADSAALFVPAAWLHLTLLFGKTVERHKKILFGLYLFSGVYFCFAFTPLFVPKVKPIMNFKYYLHPGPIFHLFTVMFFVVVPYGFFQLFRRIRTSQGDEQIQLKGFFIATLIGFCGAALSFAPNYNIPIPQFAIFLMPIYPFVTAYFMMRHRLFDIEQAVQAFQREKLATIGLLAASINHEIKNPLYAMKGLLETYVENVKEGLPHKEPLQTSEKALVQVNRALDVITKLNRFAKPLTENVPRDSKASILEALKNVLDLVSYEFELDRIHIKNEIDHNLPPIQADQRQLEEILFNLIVNACHAMKKGTTENEPRTTIIGTLELRGTWDMDRVTIAISDTGMGISPEQSKHIFEPFYTTKGDQGTGLGLYITRQLVERNGGHVSVKSEAGKGTVFTLEFKTK